ncbi:transcriptional regulator family: C2H2 zinc finger [Penicillium taxi]|uniref:transcriptional regulator family: C2H2 zinc finger n=1 Tax=Penicillium taxi TaxID=168475 RepID=UPI002545750A|nr:transcriptional regulator family: C2H2 zinc finger [Penicillium taxi]KAJ5888525.1 transcriptional regulator family: C2H2 zinc finger [Penicillium taxi]
MASFLPVNNSKDHPMDGPSTPRASNPETSVQEQPSIAEQSPDLMPDREDISSKVISGHARTSSMSDETMHGDSDGEHDGSDNEGEPGNAPPSKKKKGQRFFCTDFPPCNLSFTRSEHLARHIRKHTGERPFQCHCSRRFSRLDNLRQHAQTVHVNEEIPGDSLAATGTRFQRQVRTDRVRPPGRARAGTGGSVGGHSRGHSRNLSTSSIASTASTYSQPPELRRRPPPLIMSNDPAARSRLGLDPMGEPPRTPPGQIRGMAGPNVAGSPYTPSNMYTAGINGSPQYASPMSGAHGFWEGKTAARRLSVPTSSNPFLAQHANIYPSSYAPSPAGPPYPTAAGVFASPTNSSYPLSRDEATLSQAEAEIRRRTWHPSTYPVFNRPSTSGLSHYHTPDTVQPSFGANNSSEQPPRLPGIESFDKVVNRPLTPPTRKASPMQIDSHGRALPPNYGFGSGFNYNQPPVRPAPPISGPGHRRGHVSWDMSLHTNLTGLDIRDRRASRDASQWGQQTLADIQSIGSRPSSSYQPTFGPTAERSPEYHRGHAHSLSTGSRATHTSPEDSSSSEGVHTPSTASVEYHPAIVHSSGYIESHDSSIPDHHPQPICGRQASHADGYPGHIEQEPRHDVFADSAVHNSGMGRLEALVAVATSENRAPKLYT